MVKGVDDSRQERLLQVWRKIPVPS